MSKDISRRHLLTTAATGAGLAIANAVVWQSMPASADPRPGVAAAGKPVDGPAIDRLVFGDAGSEAAHGLTSTLSDVVPGALSQSARVLNPTAQPGWWGGSLTFTVQVDPMATNYVTVKLWGGDHGDAADESHNWRLQLFVDGESVGWYDEGSIDNLDLLGIDPRSPERFFLHTLPLPAAKTSGRTSLQVEIRSMGRIWSYGQANNFFYDQTEPSRPIYGVYSHSTPYFVPASDDVFGAAPAAPARENTDDDAIAQVRSRVLAEQQRLVYGGGTQNMDAWGFNALAEGYAWKDSTAFQNPDALSAICEAIDGRYLAWKADATVLTASDQQWQGFGRVGLVLAYLWQDIQTELAKNVVPGTTRLVNPGFELGTDVPLGWYVQPWAANGRLSRDASTAHGGQASAKVVSNGAGIVVSPTDSVLVGPGTLTLSGWCRTDGSTASLTSAKLDVLFFDDANRLVGSDNNFFPGSRVDTWQQITGSVQVPTGATRYQLWMVAMNGATAWFDDLTVDAPEPIVASPVARRDAYRDMLVSSRDYWMQNSRFYTNQAQIAAIGIYQANRGLSLLSPGDAWSETRARRWIHESIGLKPFLGSELPDGTRTVPLGTDYAVVTPKGLTRELGYVGNYGEVTDWLVMMYESLTRGHGAVEAPEVREQILKIIKTRAYFRHFDVDAEGKRISRLETEIGWRNEVYPGIADYVQPTHWDSSPVMAAGAFGDTDLVGWTQEMFDDGQFGPQLQLLTTNLGTRVGLAATRTLARDLPDFRAAAASSARMPAGWSAPDYVFTDEVAGAIAVKNGQELFFASLYWRARAGVNGWGRVHLVTPSLQRSATVRERTDGELSATTFTVQDWVTWDYAINDATGGPSPIPAGGWSAPGDVVHQAFSGEVMQQAKLPAGVDPTFGSPTLGTEAALVGLAPFYQLEYGRYIVAMNTTLDQTFRLGTSQKGKARVLSAGPHGRQDLNSTVELQRPIKIGPRSTLVLYRL
ncbi:hypothetical protein ACTJI8_17600 [Microbacterium sp. 22303]|uniref:hypothetical protein n=1 Tax=Microbacterium sp. 22303 TaxID=3453905 RepID=UPI003F88010C